MEKKFKEFKPTSWSIDNKTSVYVLVFVLAVFGLISYNSLPKEQFPEIVIPQIIVSTIYPGTSPSDMEKLVTRPLEKKLKGITDVKRITSNSIQNFSLIIVEFNTNVKVEDAKQKVKDQVADTKKDLPNDLPSDPDVKDIDLSELPIMQINLAGDYDLQQLKKYADLGKDRMEELKQIKRVDIVGALDREIHIDVDMYRAQAANVTFGTIENAVAFNNVTVSGGNINMQGMSRSIRINGELPDVETLKNITVTSSSGALIKLKDIANIKDSFHDQESYARLNGKNVVTLNVIKRAGENLLDASDEIDDILKNLKESKYPKDLNVYKNGDQSKLTRSTLFDLNNTIIIGFVLVTMVLMFFMGLTNAFFVGLSVPLSMFLAYIILPFFGFSMNMLVMFAFIFALGIVVDDAIVVIENTHRIYKKERMNRMNIITAAKFAAGEVFLPILSGTLTTLAPFFPLAFWPGTIGKFMYFIPVTLIVTLFASLIVAYIINPVFAIDFMKHDDTDNQLPKKKIFRNAIYFAVLAAIFYMLKWVGVGNFTILFGLLYLFHNFYGHKVLSNFQHVVIPKIMDKYENLLKWVLNGKRPRKLMWGLVIFSIIIFFLYGKLAKSPILFPTGDPNNIYVYIKLPVGTAVETTDSVTKIVEQRVMKVLGDSNPVVESVVANVALGASENMLTDFGTIANKSKISVNFVEFANRHGAATLPYMDKFREAVKGIPGADITVDKRAMGPPTGKPVNIEIYGYDFEELVETSSRFISFIDSLNIPGIEKLKTDFDKKKPELVVEIDRERANHEGISTGQIGMEISTSILGKEVSKFRDGEDQYPIELRYNEYMRNDIDRLMNLKITYRDMASGLIRQIPISSVAHVVYQNTYGGITRKNAKRMITVYSNVLTGYNPSQIIPKIKKALPSFRKSENIDFKITGEQEDTQDTVSFMAKAMLLSLFAILFILITQFNSILKPLIIISEVIFSVVGVLIGYMIFGLSFSFIMSGMGVVALAGIVVRNGILLVEFTDVLKERGLKTRDAIIQGGKTRITPVLLTATATILGLIPLAIGLNIDFISLFTHLSPHIHFGGDNVAFFGTLAWTIIFGLSFATVLTLVFIPIMYYITYVVVINRKRNKSNRLSRKRS